MTSLSCRPPIKSPGSRALSFGIDCDQNDDRDQNDANAVVELIPALRAFARTFCRNPTDADDLVQETLTKAIGNLDKFEKGTRLKSWLFTIMRNTFYTRIKLAVREAPGDADCISAQPSVEAGQEWSMRGYEVQQAINRLPPAQREVLILIGMLGVSYEETASICGCAIGTIKSRLNRARANILELLGENSAETLVETGDRHVLEASEAARKR
jgi:RNA polymerase sigma factor (sigma-70 family)